MRFLMGRKDWLEVLPGPVFRGEVELALKVEQAETLEDLICRRLQLDCLGRLDAAEMAPLAEIYLAHRPGREPKTEMDELLEKLAVFSEAQPSSGAAEKPLA